MTKFSDERLFQLCKRFGKNALYWRQRFIGLLPEVNRRRLYEKKGFSSIFEFSFKLCGLSADQVNLTLNLSKRFEDKPTLKEMLEKGEVSVNKLARIVSIATVENQEELAEKVKILPISALNTLVRDEKFAINNLSCNEVLDTQNLFSEDAKTKSQNGLSKPLFEGKSLYVQTVESAENAGESLFGQTDLSAKRSLNFDPDRCITTSVLSFKLANDVKKELEELNSKGIDVNELLRKMLRQREEEIEEKKEKIAKELLSKNSENGSGRTTEDGTKDSFTHEKNDVREQENMIQTRGANKSANSNNTSNQPSRYIPAKIKQIIKEEHGTKCSIPNCQKPAEVIHHTQKLAFLAPMILDFWLHYAMNTI